MKILTHKITGEVRIIGNYGATERFPSKVEAMRDYERLKRNAIRRERNEILRDLTGTSAAAARRDMGITYL